MSYIQRIRNEFVDKNMLETSEIIYKKTHGEYRTLLHPCMMRKDIIRDLIPTSLKLEDILHKIISKQKEITRRLNLSEIPSEKLSGWLGQAALFEVIRNHGFDFKRYIEGFYNKWEKAQSEGYTLLFILGYLYHLRRSFGCVPIDLVKYLVEPITKQPFAISWDDNWITRISTNILNVTPNGLIYKQINNILKNLVRMQDGWGLTTKRIMDWTGKPRIEANHLIDIIRAELMEHRYRIVAKNTGIVGVLTKSQSSTRETPSYHSSCTSLKDGQNYFISITDMLKEDVKKRFFEYEGISINIELYDLEDKIWRMKQSYGITRTIDDIYSIIHNGDQTIPNSNIRPTRRDLLFIALLTGIKGLFNHSNRLFLIRQLTKGFDIPYEEVEKGVRNVLRKNMLRNQYTNYSILGIDREIMSITFNDKSKKVIPFLGDVLPSVPVSWLRVDSKMSYGHILVIHPSYLSCDVRHLIETAVKENDVNSDMFLVHQYMLGYPGSILRLISDE